MSAALHTADLNSQPAAPAGSNHAAQPATLGEPAQPTTPAHPNPDPVSSDHLLALVRGLITFGYRLVRALGSNPDSQLLDSFVNYFRNRNIGLVTARIIRALRMAQALEQRIRRNARQIDNPRFYLYTPRPPARPGPDSAEPAKPDSAQPDSAQPDSGAPQDEDLLAHLPTVEELARQIRHRPIGAVLADICRDLGIRPGCPNWPQLCTAIARHRGNFVRFLEDVIPNPRPVLPPGTALPQPRTTPTADNTATNHPNDDRFGREQSGHRHTAALTRGARKPARTRFAPAPATGPP